MSSPGFAPMEDHVYSAQVPINITGGIPCPTDAYISARGVVKFINNDGRDYVVQFFTRGEDPSNPKALHPDVDLFLPAFDSRTLVAGQGLTKGECKYLILPVLANSIGVDTIIREINETASASDESGSADETVKSVPLEFDVVRNAAKGGGGGTIHIGS